MTTFVKTAVVMMTALQSMLTGSPQTLFVAVDGLRSTAGNVMVFVFDNAEAFPKKRDRAFRSITVPVTGPSMCIPFHDVPAGTYGVAVYHDENSNGAMDRAWYGIPTEGYGASNGATGTFGPPKFTDASFTFKTSQDTVKIFLHY